MWRGQVAEHEAPICGLQGRNQGEHRVHMHPPIKEKGPLFITMFFLVCLFYKISTQLIIRIFNKEILAYEKMLLLANKRGYYYSLYYS